MTEAPCDVWPLETNAVAVVADCHIHAGGPQFPATLLDRLAGVGLIVTLGDMGEAAGLDRLAEIAPVVGVRGADDSDDPRTNRQTLVLTSDGQAIGCVFDPVAAGLATSSDPFTATSDFTTVARRLFGREISLLLCASTHKGGVAQVEGCAVIDPGSAVLPADGARPTYVKLTLGAGLSAMSVALD